MELHCPARKTEEEDKGEKRGGREKEKSCRDEVLHESVAGPRPAA